MVNVMFQVPPNLMKGYKIPKKTQIADPPEQTAPSKKSIIVQKENRPPKLPGGWHIKRPTKKGPNNSCLILCIMLCRVVSCRVSVMYGLTGCIERRPDNLLGSSR